MAKCGFYQTKTARKKYLVTLSITTRKTIGHWIFSPLCVARCGDRKRTLCHRNRKFRAVVFQHEVGYDDLGAGMSNVFIESGDIDISAGENFSFVKVIPDVRFIIDTGISNNPAVNFVLKAAIFLAIL